MLIYLAMESVADIQGYHTLPRGRATRFNFCTLHYAKSTSSDLVYKEESAMPNDHGLSC